MRLRKPNSKVPPPLLWRSSKQLRKERARRIASQESNKDLASEKIVDFLLKIKERREETCNRLNIASVPLTIILVIDIFYGNFRIPALGIEVANAPGLREGALFLLSLISFLCAYHMHAIENTKYIIDAVFEKRFGPRHIEITYPLLEEYNFSDVQYANSPETYVYKSRLTDVMEFTTRLISVLSISLFLVFFITIQILVWRQIMINLGLPGVWSYLVLLFSALALIFTVLVLVRRAMPLPYRDYTQTMRIVEESSPALARKARSPDALD